MGLAELPHELQLNIFHRLADDYAALSALVFVSKRVKDCASEVLRTPRTFDLSKGNTDEIEPILGALFHLAETNATAPQVHFTSTGDAFGDDIVRHASRYITLRMSFGTRFGTRFGRVAQGTQPIPPGTINLFRLAMQALTGKAPKQTVSWGQNFDLRKADASVRLILHTLRHVTTLELGGSTNCLPWDMTGMLDTLRNLQFVGIANAKLSRNCVLLACQPGLNKLEFSDMAITLGFLDFFPGTPGSISATTLRFTNCWVPKRAVERIVKACRGLVMFEYSLDTALSEAQTYWLRQWSIAEFLTALQCHRHTLKHLKIVRPEPLTNFNNLECNHIGSLADFTVLESLFVNQRFLAPHPAAYCKPRFDNLHYLGPMNTADPMAVLYKLPQSLKRLELSGCVRTVTSTLLSRVVRGLGVGGLLPGLRELRIVYTQQLPPRTATRPFTQQEQALLLAFERRGVNLKLLHTPS